AERLRHARRGADASRVARLVGGDVRRAGLEREGHPSARDVERSVSADFRSSRREEAHFFYRPKKAEPPHVGCYEGKRLLPLPPPPPRSRGNPRHPARAVR